MRNYSKYILSGVLLTVVLTSCSKMKNQYFGNGTMPVFTASTSTIAVTSTDSLTNVIAFSWTNPHYATDSATEQYIIEMDSAGHGFAQPFTITVTGALSDSVTAKTLNNAVLGLGGTYRVPYTTEVRLVSSYGNNNEQFVSNTLALTITPYVVPPKVKLPTGSLYLVGSATAGGWNNPVPVPSQVFEKVDSVDYAGVFKLSAGGQFLILPVNGDWTNKFATADNSETGTGGAFAYNASNNFTGPAAAGWYTIWLNFQTGSFSIAAAADSVPDSLFMVGSATADAWNNPVPEPSQVFSRINSSQISLSAPLSAAGQLLFLPVNGSWTNKYATSDASETGVGGTFGYNASSNFTGPTNAGTYTILVDFVADKFTISSQ